MLFSNRWLIAIAVLLPAALLALAGWLNYRQVRNETVRDATQTSAALSEHALRTLRAHELIAGFVDQSVQGWDWQRIIGSKPLHDALVRLVDTGDDVASVFLLAPDGRRWASSRRFPMPPIDGSDRDYFVALRDGAKVYVSELGRGRLGNDRFFSVARRKSSADGRFDGLIGVSVNPEYFERFYAGLVETPRDAIGLVRADGLIVVRYPSVGESNVRLPPDGTFMRSIQLSPRGGTYSASSFADGVERIAAYHRVGEYPLYTTFSVPTEVIWQRWRRAMLPYTIACLLAGAMLLVGAALVEQRVRRAAAEARGREAEEASRAKDRFVAALSHELRNPLAAISLATEVLERSSPRSDTRSPVGVIRRQVQQLRRMLEDLLDTSRALYGKLSLEKRRIEVRALAQVAISDQQARAAAGVQISLEGAEAWVDADPVRLAQMLENLVENAVKYGGRRIRVVVESDAQAVRVRVDDDGEGIAPELLPRLFQPFVQGEQTLDRARGGLGLGLALVDRLAALHGGALSVQSEGPGRGASFVLRLPPAASGAADSVQAGISALRRQRFLVVEDDADARERLEQLLKLEGHAVVVAASGAEALVQASAFAPDAALLDIGLPGMDGYELARRLRALPGGEALALVAVTGYGQAEDRGRALAAGFDAHVTKPYTYQELTRVLAGVSRRGALPSAQQAA